MAGLGEQEVRERPLEGVSDAVSVTEPENPLRLVTVRAVEPVAPVSKLASLAEIEKP